MNTAPKLTADQFRALCEGVSYWHASLLGARDSEVPGEAGRLQSALTKLEAAQLARRNPRLEQMRSMLIESARRTLASRMSATLTLSGYEVALIDEALSYTASYMPRAPEHRIEALRQALRAALGTGAVQS